MNSLATNWFGAVMGLAGLGLASRAAAAPRWFAEFWIVFGAILLALLLLAYLMKLFTDMKSIAEEFGDPARLGFCATLPIALTLVGGGLQPYLPRLANGVWWIGAVLLLAFQALALARWLSGGIPLEKINGGWMIMLIGGIVVPSGGMPLGNVEMSRFCFGVSAVFAPVVMGLVFHRTIAGPALTEAQRPAWFIFLVPPSLIYANGMLLWSSSLSPMLEALFFGALVLGAALLMASWTFLVWPFSALWWAFTFPLDGLALAAAQYARGHAGGPWSKIATTTLIIATIFVLIALLRSLRAPFTDQKA